MNCPYICSKHLGNPYKVKRNPVSGVYFMQLKTGVTQNLKSSPLSEIIGKFYFPNPVASFFGALVLDLDLLTSATAS